MSPAAKADDEDRRWTFEYVDRARERREDLLVQLERLREEKEELDDRIAAAVAGEEVDEDVEELRERREEVEQYLDDFESGERLLAEVADERAEVAARVAAEDRLRTIKKRVGGLAGEQDRKVERAVEALDDARRHLEKAGEAAVLGEILREEARILAALADVDPPELRRVRPPSTYEEVRDRRSRSAKSILSTPKRQQEGARRARGRADSPRGALQKLAALEVDYDAEEALALIDRAEEEGLGVEPEDESEDDDTPAHLRSPAGVRSGGAE